LGHKVHPIGFRLGVIKDWQSKWYSDTQYAEFVHEDNRLREAIKSRYSEAAISLIEIDRQAKDVTITLYTARPGIVIGRGGQRVDEMRVYLEDLVGKKIRLNIQEVRQPELDAYLVARSVAEQIERRIAYRRAMKQAIFRTIQAGAKGIKISCAGRLGNAEIARRQTSHQGQVPLHTLRADIDYGFTEAHTTLGRIGVKVWIYKGQILPELKVAEAEEAPAIEAEEKPAEAVAEEAPVAEPEEKPAEAVAEEAPVAEPEEKPVEAVAEEAPVAEPEEKPVEAVAEEAPVTEPKEKPAEAVAEEAHVAKPEEKPTKTKAKKVTRAAATAKTEEKPAKATAAAKSVKKPAKAATTAKAAEKPEKPAAKKSKKTTTEAKAEAAEITDKAEPTTTTEEEAKDAAT
jgi:small subunit ribosomal protein S3